MDNQVMLSDGLGSAPHHPLHSPHTTPPNRTNGVCRPVDAPPACRWRRVQRLVSLLPAAQVAIHVAACAGARQQAPRV